MAAQNAETSWWNHRVHSLHRERLSQVKSTMNIKDESHIVKIDSRKREFLRQQREAKIEHDNKKLVINMMQIVAKSGNEYHPKPPHKIISRAEALRRKQGQDIARENYTLAMRIINQKPSMDVNKLERDFHEHERIVKNRTQHTKHLLNLMTTGGVEHERARSPSGGSPESRGAASHSASASSILAGAGARSLAK